MSKSIKEKALSIAKEQEAERNQEAKEKFLNIMREEFEDRISDCKPWTAIGTSYYRFEEEFDSFLSDQLKTICEDVGFLLKIDCERGILLAVPEYIKGKKRTEAQLMIYHSDIEINRRIRAIKAKAREMCKEALEKIKNGYFVSSKVCDSYVIKLTVSYSERSSYFEGEVKRVFEKKGFEFISIHLESGKWMWKFQIE